MKRLKMTILILLLSISANAQILVRLGITKPNLIGYGVYLEYIMDYDILRRIENIGVPTKEELIKVWGLPLTENGFGPDSCSLNDTVKVNLYKFFQSRKGNVFSGTFDEYKIWIWFIKVNQIEYCSINTEREKWPETAAVFELAGVLKTKPKVGRFTKKDRLFLKDITRKIESKYNINDAIFRKSFKWER